jgi:3-oxoacyl-[acyl-carrier protein] reductase
VPYEDRVAFITGAAMGFGKAFAGALCGVGAKAVIADIDLEGAKRGAADLRAAGHDAIAVRCDVADNAEVEAAVAQAVAEFGGIDILINNAGKHLRKYNQPFTTLGMDEIRDLFDVNVMGIVHCSIACHAAMRESGGGVILNISSIASYGSTSPYGVSKLAVRGLTIAFANELSEANIRVNAVAPGLMATESVIADLPQDLVEEFVNERQLVNRLGTVQDIVDMMLFLCGDKATFITGETYRVSGRFPLWV